MSKLETYKNEFSAAKVNARAFRCLRCGVNYWHLWDKGTKRRYCADTICLKCTTDTLGLIHPEYPHQSSVENVSAAYADALISRQWGESDEYASAKLFKANIRYRPRPSYLSTQRQLRR